MNRPLTMPEAMELANVKSRNTVKKWIREGLVDAERLPSEKGRGHWRIDGDSVAAMLQGTLRQQALDHLRRIRA